MTEYGGSQGTRTEHQEFCVEVEDQWEGLGATGQRVTINRDGETGQMGGARDGVCSPELGGEAHPETGFPS